MSVAETTKEMALTKDVLGHPLRCFGEGDLTGIQNYTQSPKNTLSFR